MNPIAKEIKANIVAETKAINDYKALLSRRLFTNGTDRRSIKHLLKEEQDHRRILMRMLKKYD